MRNMWRRLIDHVRRFRVVDTGAAAIEFALILPIMLTLYVGAMEASTLISMDRRVQSVAGSVGDLVARSNATLSAAQLTDYFRAAAGIMTPFASTGVKQVVTQVDGTTGKVIWSRQYINGTYGVGTDHPVNSVYTLPAAMLTIGKGQTVIVAKATYSYLPLYGIVINKPVALYRENFFIPRFGGNITLN